VIASILRRDFRVYLEPEVADACWRLARAAGVRTMSRYIRRAVLLTMRAEGYPMHTLTLTDPPQHRQVLQIDKGVTVCE
jgi:hypothetical protein